ncbi:excinuclease Cho [Pectobacterium brasiliense]|uniref:excinuclease Cho n=1 Tax=Pectobacterium brasiliense TaxID=180957 RepID=UPI001CE19A4D|nr:excinuclease Cho [Pectobacterium brasiliense]MCA5920048.1 excinuclease Cho [Pectobacterium brasiliense]MCA5926991.1 excinuclease Cho [Pectobacterium brasiliense]MCA5936070.1 excinuclease Cho [Pectobacterium brasiliense]MCA5939978.1 excinuclease Cho [Pectobacterium brasiliense]MCA5944118.1 excinuclease Cho [Pectobacterium brasiliense]
MMLPEKMPDIYEYPEHLRSELDGLPTAPGVYIFYGDSETLPLYIGKSINIRARVLSHMRTRKEAKLLRQIRRITFIETAGEIGALLLEAQMIKQQAPLFNKRLRRSRQLCSLHFDGTQIEVVYAKNVDFSTTAGLYGLFSHRLAAVNALKTIADEEKLCLGVLGIEHLPAGRACFRHALKKCAGACCGKESISEHQNRLSLRLDAMKLNCWAYPGRIAIKESRQGKTDYHIVHNWFYLGTVAQLSEVATLKRVAANFDSDGYKILCRPIVSDSVDIILLDE